MAHPRRPNRKPALLDRVRELCLVLPGTTEKEAWGGPTFRARSRMFAMYLDDHHGDGRIALWIKAPEGAQEALVRADPRRFFVPPYVGSNGWVGVVLDGRPPWSRVEELVEHGYRMVAGKRLCARLDARGL